MNLLRLLTSSVMKLPKNLKDLAYEQWVKHTSTFVEPSIPFQTLIDFVDADDIKNEKNRTLALPLENINVTSKLESQNLSSEIYDSNSEVMLTQVNDQENETKNQFLKYCNYCHKANHSVPNCFGEQREDEEKKRNSFSGSKSPVKTFNHYFKAYHNHIHPNEQPFHYPVYYYSRDS